MENCIVELGGLFLSSTYQHTFVALRNLALTLRQVSTSTTPESYKMIYNWQYLHSLKLWARMVSTFTSEIDPKETLKPLVYPLVQLILGSLRLKPSAKHFPYRLHLINLLVDISEKTNVFIPVIGYIMEIFESAELKSKPKPSTLKPLDFELNIRASNEYLSTKTYHTGVVECTVNVIYRYLQTVAMDISFPEIALPMIVLFKKLAKGSEVNMSRMLQGVVEKVNKGFDGFRLRRMSSLWRLIEIRSSLGQRILSSA
jgi:nucleolar complex protein 2